MDMMMMMMMKNMTESGRNIIVGFYPNICLERESKITKSLPG
jgi:hypothetical protein